jgi:hypothetical protein
LCFAESTAPQNVSFSLSNHSGLLPIEKSFDTIGRSGEAQTSGRGWVESLIDGFWANLAGYISEVLSSVREKFRMAKVMSLFGLRFWQ